MQSVNLKNGNLKYNLVCSSPKISLSDNKWLNDGTECTLYHNVNCMTPNHTYTPLEFSNCMNKIMKSHSKVLSSKEIAEQVMILDNQFIEQIHREEILKILSSYYFSHNVNSEYELDFNTLIDKTLFSEIHKDFLNQTITYEEFVNNLHNS